MRAHEHLGVRLDGAAHGGVLVYPLRHHRERRCIVSVAPERADALGQHADLLIQALAFLLRHHTSSGVSVSQSSFSVLHGSGTLRLAYVYLRCGLRARSAAVLNSMLL